MMLNIEKTNWRKARLGDVAIEYCKRIKNPSQSEFDRFVGSDNIGQWNFRIKSWESTGSVSSSMKLFEPDDYLLVRRSLYASDFRERAPRANFYGVCSGDILTIRENPDLIEDGFLISILNSPDLWKFIVSNASGSITRRIKWNDLADYEFYLPPKKIQRDISSLLWSKNKCIERIQDVRKASLNLKNSIQRKFFENLGIELIRIGEIANVYSGGTPSRKISEYWNGDIPWIKTGEVNYNLITDTEEKITELGLKSSSAKLIQPNSVLVAMYGQGVTRGRVAITGIKAACNQASAVIEPSRDYLAEFIYFYLEYKYEDLRSLAHGANQQNLNQQMIKDFRIPNLSFEDQRSAVRELKKISQVIEALNLKDKASEALKENLIREMI